MGKVRPSCPICESILAQSIARDGEGATKLIKVNVKGAKTKAQNSAIAKRL